MTDELIPPIRVAICVPSGRSWEAETALRMMAISMRAMASGIPVTAIGCQDSVISFNRNSMVEMALSMDATHIMWVDSDNVPPVDVIARFLNADRDIVGASYCKRTPPYEMLGVPSGPVDFAKDHSAPYWLLPGGCIMVRARVYRTIPKPWYFESIRREGSPMGAFLSLLDDHYRTLMPDSVRKSFEEDHTLISWLEQEEEENKVKYNGSVNTGEDINFCMKAQRNGFSILCDIDSTCETGHVGVQTIFPKRPCEPENTP